ncbi:COG1361 S-layer family protein [Haladaptatus sp. DYSN1]|uniref:COG1361 S-layer family protein n=1 Tax=unclassified Haladaptatus TaxID=2622732 RepID=UPI002404BB4F|nr:COG1361 S-layer family protein [Haladaptatus sp. DYSN1]
MRGAIAVIFVLLVAAVTPGVVAAQVRGSPDLELYLSDNRVTPGEETELSLSILNTGDIDTGGNPANEARVTTARGTTLEVREGDAPISVKTGKIAVGSVPEGTTGPIPFSVVVDEDAEPGTYTIPVRVSYTHTSQISEREPFVQQERSVSETLEVTLVVEDESRFEILGTSSDVAVGDSGTVTMQVRNTGNAPASDATISVQSPNSDVTLGAGAQAAESYVGSWAAGETKEVTYRVNVAEEAERRTYSLQATIGYDNEEGQAREAGPLATGFVPSGAQEFEIGNVESTLRVDSEGTISGQVANTGDVVAENAVLVLETQTQNLNPVETEVALGTLEPGQGADFAFDVEVGSEASAGPRQFTFRLEYRNEEGEKRQSDPLDTQVTVGEKQKEFTVQPVNATVEAGSGTTLEVTVTNNGDEPLTDISAKLFADSPLSTTDDEAFIQSLGPGESATIKFAVSADGAALEKDYPVSMDFQYDNARGDTLLSDTYQVAVQVEEPEDGGLPIIPIAAGAILVALIGLYILYRRQ